VGVTIHDAIDEFVFAKATEGVAQRTLVNYRLSMLRFTRWSDVAYPGLRTEGMTADVIRGYITSLQAERIREVTVSSYVRILRVFVRWLEKEGHIDASPFNRGRVKVPKYGQTFPEAIEPETFERLLKACNLRRPAGRRDHAIIRFLYDTGVRVGELCNLTLDDIDVPGGRAKVHGKGRRERMVFFGAETQRSLQRYRVRLAGSVKPDRKAFISKSFFLTDVLAPLKPNTVQQILKRSAIRASVTDRVNPHGFRHGFGVGYVMRGGDIRSLQQIMGHAAVTTTEMYTHMTEDQLASMHTKFSPAGHRGS